MRLLESIPMSEGFAGTWQVIAWMNFLTQQHNLEHLNDAILNKGKVSSLIESKSRWAYFLQKVYPL